VTPEAIVEGSRYQAHVSRAREPGGNAPPGPEHASRGVTRAWVLLPSSLRRGYPDATPGIPDPQRAGRQRARDDDSGASATARVARTEHDPDQDRRHGDAPHRGLDRRLRRGNRRCDPRTQPHRPAEVADLPVAFLGDLAEFLVRVHRYRLAHDLEHREVGDGVAVRVGP